MENANMIKESPTDNPSFVEYLRKKRPDAVKLDIEKMFQQSIELTEMYNKLSQENKKLQKQYRKVEQAKNERQVFISTVQKIVKQKSQEISDNNANNSSWLVFKLHKKIDSLKNQISQKDKSIQKLKLSKENQILYRKQIELECLNQIAEKLQKEAGDEEQIRDDSQDQVDEEFDNEDDMIKNIVWMEDHLKSEEQALQELEAELQHEERETKKIMKNTAIKRNELKNLKQMMREYNSLQENYKIQKKKKEQKMVGNKNYLTMLMKERDNELEKIDQLRKKQEQIQEQQRLEIEKLEKKLQELQQFHENNKNQVNEDKEEAVEVVQCSRKEEWVKRVSLDQVKGIARNINYDLRLKKVSQKQWISLFFEDDAPEYSIGQIIQKLAQFPFCLQDTECRKLIARYAVQDQDQGFMLQDQKTSQSAPIIKSVLMKLIGDIKIYSNSEIEEYHQNIGDKLSKFSTLVEQAVQLKDGNIQYLNQERLREGIQFAELDFNQSEVQFITLYLFSLSKDTEKLDIKKLGKLKQIGIKWNKYVQELKYQ